MKQILSLLATGAMAFGLSTSAYAQTGGVEGAALILHDDLGHTVTLQTPVNPSPAYTAWAAGGFAALSWSIPIPPVADAQSGFLIGGPTTGGPYGDPAVGGQGVLLPYWVSPNTGPGVGIGVNNNGGVAGAYDFATPTQLGLAAAVPGGYLPLSGGTMTGDIAMGTHDISGAGTITAANFVGNGAGLTGVVASNTNQLETATWEAPGTIGSTTPNTGSFTTLTSSSGTANSIAASITNTGGSTNPQSAIALAVTSNGVGTGTNVGLYMDVHSGATNNYDIIGTGGWLVTSVGGGLFSHLSMTGAIDMGTNNITNGGSITGTSLTASAGDVTTTGNLNLPTTTGSTGIIEMGSLPWIYGYGTDNIFFGQSAGNFGLTTGSATDNVGIGQYALQVVTTGAFNTGVGSFAVNSMDAGSSNTGIGYIALGHVTSGNDNAGIGNGAGYTISTGSQNTFLGSQADADVGGRTNATAIGYGAIVTADNTIQLGNGSVTTVNTSGTLNAQALTVSGDVTTTTGGNLVAGGHIVTTSVIGSIFEAGTATLSSVTGSDVAGTVTFSTTGAGVGIVTVNFGVSYGVAPIVILTAANVPAGTIANNTVLFVTPGAAAFSITFNATAAYGPAIFNYVVIH